MGTGTFEHFRRQTLAPPPDPPPGTYAHLLAPPPLAARPASSGSSGFTAAPGALIDQHSFGVIGAQLAPGGGGEAGGGGASGGFSLPGQSPVAIPADRKHEGVHPPEKEGEEGGALPSGAPGGVDGLGVAYMGGVQVEAGRYPRLKRELLTTYWSESTVSS